MTVGAVLWVALLAVLVALFILTARRMSVLADRTRDLERVQRAVESIDRRLAAATDPLVGRLDDIRRRSGDPQGLVRDLEPARAMLEELASETRALHVPAVLSGQAAVMVHETERAVRAAELVRHGLDALLATRGSRELEAQTSLKRGALNLRHARDAFGRAAAEVAAIRPADVARHVPAGPRTSITGTAPAHVDMVDSDPEEPFEPRM